MDIRTLYAKGSDDGVHCDANERSRRRAQLAADELADQGVPASTDAGELAPEEGCQDDV